jgi:hypothetical protein
MTELSTDQIHAMTPERAGVELARRTADYQRSQTGNSAQAALDKFANDPTIAQKIFGCDVATLKQFHDLTAAVAGGTGPDVLKNAIAPQPVGGFDLTFHGEMPARDRAAAIDELRSSGISDYAIAEALIGTEFSVADVARTRALKAQRMGDAEWTKRLMNGGYAERREFTLMSIILSGAA